MATRKELSDQPSGNRSSSSAARSQTIHRLLGLALRGGPVGLETGTLLSLCSFDFGQIPARTEASSLRRCAQAAERAAHASGFHKISFADLNQQNLMGSAAFFHFQQKSLELEFELMYSLLQRRFMNCKTHLEEPQRDPLPWSIRSLSC